MSKRKGHEHIDLALFTDGLRDESAQGITIDVAYRYFTTPKRKFIIADTPGHIQYTRNMVTGASTANVALILIDARNRIIEQTKRHAFIASLLQIPHIIVCVNKMDLADYSEQVYEDILYQFTACAMKSELEVQQPLSNPNNQLYIISNISINWDLAFSGLVYGWNYDIEKLTYAE